MTFFRSVGEASVVLVVLLCIVLPESVSEYENIAISAIPHPQCSNRDFWNGTDCCKQCQCAEGQMTGTG